VGSGFIAFMVARLLENDPIIRMRASDALEKISRQPLDWLQPYIPQLLTEIGPIDQPSVQWHLAQILGQVQLTP